MFCEIALLVAGEFLLFEREFLYTHPEFLFIFLEFYLSSLEFLLTQYGANAKDYRWIEAFARGMPLFCRFSLDAKSCQLGLDGVELFCLA